MRAVPAPKLPPALRALLDVGGTLLRQSASGRMALGRAAAVAPADALPGPLQGLPPLLERARTDASEPLPAKDVEKILKHAWRKPPAKVLDDLDPEPVAVTPTAQVHRGSGDDGPVAVKVRRPGLASAVRNDLALLDALGAPLRQVFGRLDTGAVLREVREMALDELDLEHEGSTLRRVRRVLRGVDGLTVPSPVLDLCHEDVLVTTWLEGPTLRDAEPGDPAAVAAALAAAHAAAAREGFLLTDPRPGHVVLLADGTVGLLGAGVARPIDRARVSHGLAALEALRAGDPGAFAARVAGDLDLLPDTGATTAHDLLDELLGTLLRGPARLDGPALAAAGDGALRRLGPLLDLGAEVTPHPQDLAVVRMLWQLGVVLSRLEATEDWGAHALGA